MRGADGRRLRAGLIMGVVLLLVMAGILMIFRIFQRNRGILLNNEDNQLVSLARSVDRSVVSYLDRYAVNLDYVTGRPGFVEAEEKWLATGESGGLLAQIQGDLVEQYELTRTVLAIRGERVVLSTDGNLDYRFPGEGGMVGDMFVWVCYDREDTACLAILKRQDSGVTYASLIDLHRFYRRVAGELSGAHQERVMLVDGGEQMLLHTTLTGIHVNRTADMTEDSCDYHGLQLMLAGRGKEPYTDFHEVCPYITGEPYTARMAVLPAAAGENGFFTIGVSSNYDQFIRPIREAAINLVAYSGMVVGGVVVLFILALRGDRRSRRVMREIAALREKNEAMEALNEQTLKLAHHQRLEIMGTLTSSIAHEFNNLLTPIMGYSILALEKLPPEETEIYDSLLEIYSASKKAKDIISRLSDLSRKNTGLTYQYVSPDELVRRALEVAVPAQPPQVEVRTELNCRHVWVHGNETQLSQVLLNLILNAFHAMEGRGGVLTVFTGADESHVIFRVSDTGCGIPEQVLPDIFEPFFTTKETGKGTGLGLAIVRQVVDGHQGQIRVDTEEGVGTTFTITFPLHVRQES